MSEKAICDASCPCNDPCPMKKAISIIGGKWKAPILCALKADGTARYNDLLKKIDGITNTMLASSLKELERDALVTRTVFNTMPLRVEYSLTEKSERLIPILQSLVQWYGDIY